MMYVILCLVMMTQIILPAQQNILFASIVQQHQRAQTRQTPLSHDILINPENNITPIHTNIPSRTSLTFPPNFEINVDNVNVVIQTVQGFVFTQYLAYNPRTNAPEMRLRCSSVLLQDGTEMSLQNIIY